MKASGQRFIPQRRVRPDRVVVLSPAFDDDPGFLERAEDLAVKQFIGKVRVEALTIAVLPRAAGLDIGRPGPDRSDPFLDGFGTELRAIVRTYVIWNATQDELVCQNVDDVGVLELAIDPDRQTLPSELVDEYSVCGISVRHGCDPRQNHRTRRDWAAPAANGCRTRHSTRAACASAVYKEPSAPPAAISARHASSFIPSLPAQQRRNPAIAVTAILLGKVQ